MHPKLEECLNRSTAGRRLASLAAAIGFGIPALGGFAWALWAPTKGLMFGGFCLVPTLIAVVIYIQSRNAKKTPLGRALLSGGDGLSAFYVREVQLTAAGFAVGDSGAQIVFESPKHQISPWLMTHQEAQSIMPLLAQAMPHIATSPS